MKKDDAMSSLAFNDKIERKIKNIFNKKNKPFSQKVHENKCLARTHAHVPGCWTSIKGPVYNQDLVQSRATSTSCVLHSLRTASDASSELAEGREKKKMKMKI